MSEAVDYTKLTVAEIKDLLKEKGLPVTGVKAELVARLEENGDAPAADATTGEARAAPEAAAGDGVDPPAKRQKAEENSHPDPAWLKEADAATTEAKEGATEEDEASTAEKYGTGVAAAAATGEEGESGDIGPTAPPAAPAPTEAKKTKGPGGTASMMAQLKELTQMKNDGSLTEEEFTQFKDKLMKAPVPGGRRGNYGNNNNNGGPPASWDHHQKPREEKPRIVHPEGSWTCGACGNINWPMRTHCNRTGCNVARPYNETVAGQYQAMATQQGHPGTANMGQRAAAAGNDSAMGAKPGVVHPEGSWSCRCGNVNWPMRTHCNLPNCGLPKPGTEQEVGYEPRPGKSSAISHPEGSWTCPYCGNVNWPQRTVCNKQECRMQRPDESEMEAYRQQQQQYQQQQMMYGQMAGQMGQGQMGQMGMQGYPQQANMQQMMQPTQTVDPYKQAGVQQQQQGYQQQQY